ncbi:hypothetical protein PSHT_08215 [Puccinia striiformis]|uniref:Uncharacterized protein n=1 Tax=Puccinia striiformis TaxID=27350 RepID=A0A2S4VRB6_9BASI|nr:hypothetical protein PSHT_08215 [Puccinia striiformis]
MAYDVLYILTPYRVALCSKILRLESIVLRLSLLLSSMVQPLPASSAGKSANSSASDFGAMVSSVFGDKLVTQLGGSNPTQPALRTRDSIPANSTTTSAQQQIYNPNPDTYTNTNLAFLFLSPYLSDKALCKPCTQSVWQHISDSNKLPPITADLLLRVTFLVNSNFGNLSVIGVGLLSSRLSIRKLVLSILTTSAANAFNLIFKNSVNLATLSFVFLSIRFLHLI